MFFQHPTLILTTPYLIWIREQKIFILLVFEEQDIYLSVSKMVLGPFKKRNCLWFSNDEEDTSDFQNMILGATYDFQNMV